MAYKIKMLPCLSKNEPPHVTFFKENCNLPAYRKLVISWLKGRPVAPWGTAAPLTRDVHVQWAYWLVIDSLYWTLCFVNNLKSLGNCLELVSYTCGHSLPPKCCLCGIAVGFSSLNGRCEIVFLYPETDTPLGQYQKCHFHLFLKFILV